MSVKARAAPERLRVLKQVLETIDNEIRGIGNRTQEETGARVRVARMLWIMRDLTSILVDEIEAREEERTD